MADHTSERQVVSETTIRETQAAEQAAAAADAAEKKARPRRSKDKADHQAPADTTTPPEKEAT